MPRLRGRRCRVPDFIVPIEAPAEVTERPLNRRHGGRARELLESDLLEASTRRGLLEPLDPDRSYSRLRGHCSCGPPGRRGSEDLAAFGAA